jgi:hypothetical protein
MCSPPASLQDALVALGKVLEDRNLSYQIAVVGGGSLLLSGWLERPTRDLDVMALVEGNDYVIARPLPAPLRQAAGDVAALLGLGEEWLNAGPTDQLTRGLPPGFSTRVEVRRYGGLTVHLAGRHDQICLKLYAAVDDHRRGKHYADLLTLAPTTDEIRTAAIWVKSQEAPQPFSDLVDQAAAALLQDLGHEG